MADYPAETEQKTCIFCNIIAENNPDKIFWEDEHHIAFLSIDPNTLGYSLVVPKKHYGSDILKMPDDALQNFILAAKKVAGVLENYYEDVGRVGLIMEGTGIDHAHIKLVPMHGTEYLKQGGWKQQSSGVEHWFDTYPGWLSSAGGPMANMEELEALTKKLRESQ